MPWQCWSRCRDTTLMDTHCHKQKKKMVQGVCVHVSYYFQKHGGQGAVYIFSQCISYSASLARQLWRSRWFTYIISRVLVNGSLAPWESIFHQTLRGGKWSVPAPIHTWPGNVPEHSRGRLHGAVLKNVTVTHTNIHKCVDKSHKILSREIRYQRFGPQPQCLTLWASLCVSGCVWAGQLFGLIPPWGHSLLLITSVTHFSPVFLFPLIISPPFLPRLSASFLVLPLFSCV